MKKLFLFLIALFPLFVFAVSTPQGEELTVQITGTASNSATISITAKDIIRFTQPLETVTPEIEYRGPTGTVRVTPGNLQCSGTKCNGNFQRSISQLTCNTNYQGLVRVRTRNTTIQSGFLEEPFQFQTRPCVSQLDTVIENVNSTKDTITALVVIPIPTSTPLAGRTSFTFTLTAQKDDSDPISKTVTVSESASTRIETSITLSDLTCESTYEIVASSKIENRDNTPSEPQEVETSSCPPSTSGGGGSQQTTGDNTYVFLTPLPLGEGLDAQDSVVIGAGQGGVLGILQRIFTLMLIAAVVLAVVFMIIGGARYATGDTLGGVQGGRQIITNAVTGLLIALLSWLLLNIINPDLLRFTLSIPNIKEFLSQDSGNPVDTGGGTDDGEGCSRDTPNEECFEEITEDEDRVRGLFEQAGISINKEPCSEHGAENCTNVGKLNQTVIDEVIKLKQDCDAEKSSCEVVITGGTEYWLHGQGGNHRNYTAVDLSLGDTNLNSFIRSKTTVSGNNSWCHGAFKYSKLFLCDEKASDRHWHVDLRSSGGGSQQTSGDLIKFENIGANNRGVWGKASGRPISTSEVGSLASSARSKSWYREVQNTTGSNAKTITAIIMIESSGDPNKEVTVTLDNGRTDKACGLGQIITSTAKRFDTTNENKSVDEICSLLKNPSYNIRLMNQYYREISGDQKRKLAEYNGGSDAVLRSADCEGLFAFECPWEESGCYEPSKPNEKPTNTSCQVNTGFEETRFYVDKVKKVSDQL